MSTVRWGIVGTGEIANAVAGDFQFVPGAELAAVASRTKEKAQEFAARHGVKHAYGSYRELLESPEVDVVYISTPHPYHRDVALAALPWTDAGNSDQTGPCADLPLVILPGILENPRYLRPLIAFLRAQMN